MTEFRVRPDDLIRVANRVANLKDMLEGSNQNVGGNVPNYTQDGDKQAIHDAIKGFLANESDDAFTKAYGFEHQGILNTYKEMVTQLGNLETACRTTAEGYAEQDKATSDVMNNQPTED
ncbi:hypothetical protein [Nocardioides jensenii]|uniref:hypothetical protein n=1 Tax=Nocardioides jensenii TaxID=1843 RepID=UPI00082BBF1F|nr:hypothetical protein [Nocardioides jensenii]